MATIPKRESPEFLTGQEVQLRLEAISRHAGLGLVAMSDPELNPQDPQDHLYSIYHHVQALQRLGAEDQDLPIAA